MDIERIIIDAESGGIRYTIAMLNRYIEEAKSNGDKLDADTFCDEFQKYLMKYRVEMEQYE